MRKIQQIMACGATAPHFFVVYDDGTIMYWRGSDPKWYNITPSINEPHYSKD